MLLNCFLQALEDVFARSRHFPSNSLGGTDLIVYCHTTVYSVHQSSSTPFISSLNYSVFASCSCLQCRSVASPRSYTVGACPNKKLTLSPLCVLRHASASVGDTSIVSNFSHRSFFSSCGTVFVTTTLDNLLSFSVCIALPLRMP